MNSPSTFTVMFLSLVLEHPYVQSSKPFQDVMTNAKSAIRQ